jgi:carbon-monoxide dehydrogenase medium subunit
MKPAPFEYYAATSTDEALAYMARLGYDAKALAGGQSLIPTMNFRLAQPRVLVDLNPVSELFYIRPEASGGLLIGAMTRASQLERDSLVAERAPLVREALPHIAHPQIRNRSTIGGSLAHADPAAELPAVALALDARLHIRGDQGERWVSADAFFVGMFTTEIEPHELLVEIALPPMPSRTGWSFQEVARRHGDYALVGVAATVTLDEQRRCRQARLVFLSVGEMPMAAFQAVGLLQGQVYSPDLAAAAAETAAGRDIDPGSDIHASAAYRRHLAKVLTRRALTQAFERAAATDGGGRL